MIGCLALGLSPAAAPAAFDSTEPPVTVADITGVRAGTLSHAGETEPMALEVAGSVVTILDKQSKGLYVLLCA